MNALWPLVVILVAGGIWYLLRYVAAPQPFYIALYVVTAILLLIWLLGVLGLMGPLNLHFGTADVD